MLIPNTHRCKGAAMVEFHAVALLALLPLCLGTLQVSLLLVENHHLDHAAFLAVRHASVKHGDLAEARRAFTRAASTLFVESSTPLDRGNIVQRVGAAYAAATVDIATHASLRILAPDNDAGSDFMIRRDGQQIVPNDSLESRSAAPGRRSGVPLQEANVLRIEIIYCRPVIVPFAGPMLVGTLRRFDHDPSHQRCYASGRIPIRSEGVAPMQSDFRVSS